MIVNNELVIQPVDVNANEIVALPVVIPVAIPVVAPTLTTDVLLLLHVPGPEASVKDEASPEQILVAPEITAGNGLTVIKVATEHPFGNV